MNFPFYIAKRYLFSKKSKNIINILSIISMVGIGVGAMALIIVLSAFNGMETLVEEMYNTFDPELTIKIKEGKTFDSNTTSFNKIKQLPAIKYYTKTLEETVLLEYKDLQTVATLKGVSNDFARMSGIDSSLYNGEFILKKGEQNLAVVGRGIAYNLSLYLDDVFETIKIYAPKRTGKISLNPENAFKKQNISASGIFSISQDFDFKYIIVPLRFARILLERKNNVTSIEIGLQSNANLEQTQTKIKTFLGADFEVKTRYQLNEMMFKTNKTEKWVTFLILTFILVIATFNVIGSITILVIDKKQDINTFISMGVSKKMIKKIFMAEGLLITFIGGGSGILLGLLLVLLQSYVGLISLEGIIVEYYPVELHFNDLALVLITVMIIGFISSWFPSNFVIGRQFKKDSNKKQSFISCFFS